jgi:hypothetical protein
LLLLNGKPQFVQKPFHQGFASEEKGRVFHIENAQTAVRTSTIKNGLPGARSGLNATDAGQESVECILVIERIAKLDPSCGSQKSGQTAAFSPSRAWQENGNHAKMPVTVQDTAIYRRSHFFILPGAETAGTNKYSASFRFSQCLFNRRLPLIARNQIPLVQPSLYAFFQEPPA